MKPAAVIVIVFIVGGLLLRVARPVLPQGGMLSDLGAVLFAMLAVAWCRAVGSLVIRLFIRPWKELVTPSLIAVGIVIGLSFWIHTNMPFPVIGWPLALAVAVAGRDFMRSRGSASPKEKSH
jgi:hypothetical protein